MQAQRHTYADCSTAVNFGSKKADKTFLCRLTGNQAVVKALGEALNADNLYSNSSRIHLCICTHIAVESV